MTANFRNTGRIVQFIGKATLALFVLYGVVLVLFPLLPFWLDEWLLLDNLKFRHASALWGHLEHTQQFPRLYLALIKALAAACDYSYFSLRLPAFLAHCFGLALLRRLASRIFPEDWLLRWLWILIYVSFNTSIHYFVQLKQYTMEMALSLLAIWQLRELLRIRTSFPGRRALLSLSLLLAPFFSYTYPIVLAPVCIIVAVGVLRQKRFDRQLILPLLTGIAAVTAAYFVDTRQVLADPGMQDFWQDLLLKSFSAGRASRNIWMMFCTLGSGDLFGNLFGALGLAGLIRATWLSIRGALPAQPFPLLLYSCLLVWLAIALFLAGKLPLGTFRLNSFLVPAIAYLIVDLLRACAKLRGISLPVRALGVVLFLAACGNVYATMAELAGEEHRRKLAIYRASEQVLRTAREKHLPVFVSAAIAFPFEDRWPGDWILKVQPAYRAGDPIRVFRAPMNAGPRELRVAGPQIEGDVLYLDGPAWKQVHLR